MEAGAAPSANALVAVRPVWLRLAALVGVSALARFVVALATPVPWIFPDEWIYSELARSFADSGSFSVWDVQWPVRGTGPLYPVLLAPIYALSGSLEQAYVAVKAVNAVLMSLAAVPAFLLGRRLLSERMAFFAAALAVLVPAMVYTSKVMTENVAYPLFLCFILAVVRVLERPTTARQAAACGLVAVAFFARAEMLVLVPVYASALVLSAVLEARAATAPRVLRASVRRLLLYRATWLAGVAALLGVVLVLVAGAHAPTSLFGVYEDLPGSLDLLAGPRWLVYALGELDLAVGVVPFAAFLLVVGLPLRGSAAGRPVRVFVAVAVPSFLWVTALAAVYATQPRAAPHVFERYAFYVMPLFFIAFAYWIERGLPRPRPWAYAAAGGAALLPAALPFATLLTRNEWGVSSSTPGLVPWGLLAEALGNGSTMTVVVVVVCAALAAAFLRVPRERESLLRFVAVCFLWFVTLAVAVADISSARVAASRAGSEVAWVDAAVGADAFVAAEWTSGGERGLYALAEAQFFNRSVRRIYHAPEPVAPGAPSQPIPASLPGDVDYVLAERAPSPSLVVARQPGGRLVLLRVPPDGE